MLLLLNRLLLVAVSLAQALVPAVVATRTACGGNCCGGQRNCCESSRGETTATIAQGSCCSVKPPVAVASCRAPDSSAAQPTVATSQLVPLAQRCECCRPIAPAPQKAEERLREVRGEESAPLYAAEFDVDLMFSPPAALCGVAQGFTTRPAGVALRAWLCSWTC